MPSEFVSDELTQALWMHVGRVEGVAPEDVVAITLAVLGWPRLPEMVEETRKRQPDLYADVPTSRAEVPDGR